ncbi:MAG: HypC/HybG/HupF family hydrogenase formation chaperone [Candidatus Diapherotrites archaeon]
MCLAIPGKVAELKDGGKTALIDYGFEKREANNEFLKAKQGEWVLVQFRMAVQKVSEKEALEALKEWNELQ